MMLAVSLECLNVQANLIGADGYLEEIILRQDSMPSMLWPTSMIVSTGTFDPNLLIISLGTTSNLHSYRAARPASYAASLTSIPSAFA